MKDICCIGHITKDKIVTPRNTVYMAGGTSFYMAWGMNQLPPKASFQLVTKVAKEDMAEVERMRQAGLPLVTLEELRDRALSIIGTPAPLPFGDKVVGVVLNRDGSVQDVIKNIEE